MNALEISRHILRNLEVNKKGNRGGYAERSVQETMTNEDIVAGRNSR